VKLKFDVRVLEKRMRVIEIRVRATTDKGEGESQGTTNKGEGRHRRKSKRQTNNPIKGL